jgi:hypothetical protein
MGSRVAGGADDCVIGVSLHSSIPPASPVAPPSGSFEAAPHINRVTGRHKAWGLNAVRESRRSSSTDAPNRAAAGACLDSAPGQPLHPRSSRVVRVVQGSYEALAPVRKLTAFRSTHAGGASAGFIETWSAESPSSQETGWPHIPELLQHAADGA